VSTVTVEIPKETLALAGLEDQPASDGARRLLALELFREARVSLGRAAELSGLGVEEFMAFAADREVPLHYTGNELDQDRQAAARLGL
jgi:predicted HTH domain antitoxin